jgi:hypothetical protein
MRLLKAVLRFVLFPLIWMHEVRRELKLLRACVKVSSPIWHREFLDNLEQQKTTWLDRLCR